MKKFLYVLFGGILLGCSDRYMGDESMNMVKSEQVKVVRLTDLAQDNIHEGRGGTSS